MAHDEVHLDRNACDKKQGSSTSLLKHADKHQHQLMY
jgi:hypothetical protein